VLSAIREVNEIVKIPLVDLTFPALRRLSLPEYAAFMPGIAELVAAEQQVDLFEFALQKMLRRHLEPNFKPVPEPEVRHNSVNGVASGSMFDLALRPGSRWRRLGERGAGRVWARRLTSEAGWRELQVYGAGGMHVDYHGRGSERSFGSDAAVKEAFPGCLRSHCRRRRHRSSARRRIVARHCGHYQLSNTAVRPLEVYGLGVIRENLSERLTKIALLIFCLISITYKSHQQV